MKFKPYIKTKTERQGDFYKCEITHLHFSWEDSNIHFDYLIKNNLIKKK